jgi:hypothetical protein
MDAPGSRRLRIALAVAIAAALVAWVVFLALHDQSAAKHTVPSTGSVGRDVSYGDVGYLVFVAVVTVVYLTVKVTRARLRARRPERSRR